MLIVSSMISQHLPQDIPKHLIPRIPIFRQHGLRANKIGRVSLVCSVQPMPLSPTHFLKPCIVCSLSNMSQPGTPSRQGSTQLARTRKCILVSRTSIIMFMGMLVALDIWEMSALLVLILSSGKLNTIFGRLQAGANPKRLHHCNVDRLFAIWQELYPNKYVESWEDPNRGPVNVNTKLAPFNKTTKADKVSFPLCTPNPGIHC
jgi:hypothetical protein